MDGIFNYEAYNTFPNILDCVTHRLDHLQSITQTIQFSLTAKTEHLEFAAESAFTSLAISERYIRELRWLANMLIKKYEIEVQTQPQTI